MKNILLKLTLLFAVSFFVMSCEKEELIDANNLPAVAGAFLNEHFKGVKVRAVIREKEPLSGTEYNVLLDNNIEVNFDENGDWTEVKARQNISAIPTSFVLVPIVDYVKTNYENAEIHSIDKEKHGFDVELTNGLELVFDTKGDFIRIDL